MLRTCLLEGLSTKPWVDKAPGIMLTLNAMPHEPHGFSASTASMIATGHEPTLPPDLTFDASPSPAVEDTPGYVETIQQRLQLTRQQKATSLTTPVANPYQVGSLIFPLTTPPECTSKLAPRWKGPYRVCRTIHINHAKPAKFTTHKLLEPVPPAEAPRPPLGYLPAGLVRMPPKQRAPPESRNVAPAPSLCCSSRTQHATSHCCASQSVSRTCSSSPAVSQAQP